jgi:hypothetical protein
VGKWGGGNQLEMNAGVLSRWRLLKAKVPEMKSATPIVGVLY